MQQVADCPCDEHQDAFVHALGRADQLMFKVVDTNIGRLDGPHRVGADEDISLEQVAVDGQTFLLAFPDLDAARRHDPAATFVGIERHQALAMVVANADLDGLLVAAATDNAAWAAASRGSLANLLAG